MQRQHAAGAAGGTQPAGRRAAGAGAALNRRAAGRRPPAAGLLAAFAAFVVYGSLLPFAWQPLPLDAAWAAFLQTPFLTLGIDSRADWVANGLLYAPLGALAGAALLQRRRAALSAALSAWLAGCALAVAVEFAQLYFPGRTVSQNDLLAEAIGSAVGALLAPWALRALQRAWATPPARWFWPGYAALYAAGVLFPFDFLLSADELRQKAASPQWSLLLAGPLGGRALTILLAEAVLAVPIGWWLARRRGAAAAAGVALPRAVLTGVALGAAAEVAQFFVAAGVSQGASVLARAAGGVFGVLVAARWSPRGAAALQRTAGRLAPAWLPLWLLSVLAASGLLTLDWRSPAAAATVAGGLNWLPLYYHYFTSEALAAASLAVVVLLYLPLAVAGCGRGWRPGVTASVAAAVALAVEAAKLFADGLRPDPTNVLIAAAGVALGQRLLAALARPVKADAAVDGAPQEAGAHGGPVSTSGQSTAATAEHGLSPPALAGGAGQWHPAVILACALAAVGALRFPLAPLPLLAGLAACAAASWRWPWLPLVLLPLALPVFDLAPWSGRFFVDEFDLLSLACLALALQRTRGLPAPPQPLALRLAFGLLAFSLAASTLRALWPWPGIDANSFNHYHSAFNALRIAKGAVWAALLLALWRRLGAQGRRREQALGAGIVGGLALTVAAVLAERAAFVSLADVSADYRVTGLISAMHKGGAFIECWLAVGSAFALAWALRAAGVWQRATALLLLAGAGYAMTVTYSRNGYAALAVVLAITLVTAALQRRRGLAWGAGAAAVVVAASLPVLLGPFARERLAASAQDLGVRQAHWQDGLQLRDDSLATALFGIGLGRYPQAHFWRSREPVRAASYNLGRDGERPFLRLGSGATLYIEQVVARPPPGPLRLRLQLRAVPPGGAPALQVALCEKWTLTSRGCVGAAAPATTAGWQTATLLLDTAGLPPPGAAPLKLALLTPQAGAVDVAGLSVTSADGRQWLANGGFEHGLDRWFFSTDTDPPWQLHSLPLTVLLEQGWLGVVAWLALLAGALAAAWRLARRGGLAVPGAPAALAGFLTSGLLNTLIDAPRFLGLLLLLAGLCAQAAAPVDGGGKAAAAS